MIYKVTPLPYTAYIEFLLPLTKPPLRLSAAPDSPTSNFGADPRKNLKMGWQDAIVIDDNLLSYGIKAVFLWHQSTVLMELKLCSREIKAVFL